VGVDVAGLVTIAFYALSFWHQQGSSVLTIWAAAAGYAGASAMAGILVGFLFGLPRLTSDASAASSHWIASNNLAQVADWLTKIIVGLGLVQIGRAPSALAKLGSAISPSLGGTNASGPFGIAAILFAFVVGFLIGFLWSGNYFLLMLQQQDAAQTKRVEEQKRQAQAQLDQAKLVQKTAVVKTGQPEDSSPA
jgi:hypothetical protein